MPNEIQPKLIIADCDLICALYGTVYHGDLWIYEEMYIFNAVTSQGDAIVMERPVKLVNASTDLSSKAYFERRGVFVMHKSLVTLSAAAMNLVK